MWDYPGFMLWWGIVAIICMVVFWGIIIGLVLWGIKQFSGNRGGGSPKKGWPEEKFQKSSSRKSAKLCVSDPWGAELSVQARLRRLPRPMNPQTNQPTN